MITEKKLINIIVLGPIVFIPLIVVVLSFFIARANNISLNEHIAKLQNNLTLTEKQNIKSTVIAMSKHINYRKSLIKENLTLRVKSRVDNAYNIAHNIYEEYKGKLDDSEIQNIIKTALRPMIWNGDESFIWIIDYDGNLKLLPEYLQKFEDKSIFDMPNKENHETVKKEIAISELQGEGFLWSSFTKPNAKTDKQYEQLAFVKTFGHYDWYFGSAEYLDTAIERIDELLMISIEKIVDNEENYVFVFNQKGDILLNPTLPALVGKNIFKSGNKEAKRVVKKILDAIEDKKELSISYSWIHPVKNIMETKHIYAVNIPNTDWIIGSGYYESDIKLQTAMQNIELHETYQLKYNKLLLISGLLIIISLFISLFISKLLKNNFAKYKKQINKYSDELEILNDSLELKVSQRTKKLEDLTNELEILAKTDFLTKIHNRYSIMEILEVEMSRARRNNTSLTVMMFDIDYFKKINDTFGHDTGDKVLISLSSVVKNILRDIDFMGRYGGEEFMVVMPHTDIQKAKVISERIRLKVENYSFDAIGILTISLGLVELESDEDSDALFKRLDDLLYYSKDCGRNRLSY